MQPPEPATLRDAVQTCLSGFKPGGTSREVSRSLTETPGYILEDLRLLGQTPIPATLVRPRGPGPYPAVLYAHGQNEDLGIGRRELIQGSAHLQAPYGPALAAMGFASLAIDAVGFGNRRSEDDLQGISNRLAWNGQSLFALMLNDLSDALGYLATRGDVDQRCIFTLGISMGGALAFWLAAMDRRVTGSAHICSLANVQPLMASGSRHKFSPALIVPGLLRICDIGTVAGLIAPRPQLACIGGADPLTPQLAHQPALERLKDAYHRAEASAQLQTFVDPGSGHGECASMRVRVLDFLDRSRKLPLPTG